MENKIPDNLILFDGVCNFCNNSVQFIIRHDKKSVFHFASLQSEIGLKLLKDFGLTEKGIDSIVLYRDNKVHIKSGAALRIAAKLNRAYPLLYLFIIVPPFIRNAVYDYIARNRYKWFGKRESCMIPSPETKARFIQL